MVLNATIIGVVIVCLVVGMVLGAVIVTVRNSFSAIRLDFDKRIDEMGEALSGNHTELERSTNLRFDEVFRTIDSRVDKLEAKIESRLNSRVDFKKE